jgi:hypothetical protein
VRSAVLSDPIAKVSIMPHVNLEPVRAQVEVLRYVKARKAELEKIEKKARDEIEEVMGDNDIGELDGKTAITWTTHKKRQFQQRKLTEAMPEIADAFTELVEGRQFKLVNDD